MIGRYAAWLLGFGVGFKIPCGGWCNGGVNLVRTMAVRVGPPIGNRQASPVCFTLMNHAAQLAEPFGLVRLSGYPERFAAGWPTAA